MPGAPIALTALTLAATHMAGMAAFYNLAFDADVQPVVAYGTTLNRGWLTGRGLLLCPDAVAGVDARQNRHQWRFQVA